MHGSRYQEVKTYSSTSQPRYATYTRGLQMGYRRAQIFIPLGIRVVSSVYSRETLLFPTCDPEQRDLYKKNYIAACQVLYLLHACKQESNHLQEVRSECRYGKIQRTFMEITFELFLWVVKFVSGPGVKMKGVREDHSILSSHLYFKSCPILMFHYILFDKCIEPSQDTARFCR